jgi:ectoine hydroxylase-related dioxygenase (phytanoyl-CoA dioxygenase family)
MPLSEAELQGHVAALLKTSVTVLPDVVPVALIETLAQAFAPRLEQTVSRCGGAGNRGPHRYYDTLPFEPPWCHRAIIDHDDVLALIAALLGRDALLCQLGIDTPLCGSDRQHLHRDAGFLFPEAELATPPYLLAVNIPLVDVTPETGPMEYAPGTQNLADPEALRQIEAGDIALRPVLLKRGDVMVRDVRHIHRGTANRTSSPRPMLVVSFSRPWMRRHDVKLHVTPAVLERLPERARAGLRFATVTGEAAPGEERSVLPAEVRAGGAQR